MNYEELTGDGYQPVDYHRGFCFFCGLTLFRGFERKGL
jgi:hypothetical protein